MVENDERKERRREIRRAKDDKAEVYEGLEIMKGEHSESLTKKKAEKGKENDK